MDINNCYFLFCGRKDRERIIVCSYAGMRVLSQTCNLQENSTVACQKSWDIQIGAIHLVLAELALKPNFYSPVFIQNSENSKLE